ncbi:hypothetical protein HDE_01850 [Halotydeus destructor]|nr:hypothetical protein HDE_01850 [Halotydeus destructor]
MVIIMRTTGGVWLAALSTLVLVTIGLAGPQDVGKDSGKSALDATLTAYCGCYHDELKAQQTDVQAKDTCRSCWAKCFDKYPVTCFKPCLVHVKGAQCTASSSKQCADQFAKKNPGLVSKKAPSGNTNCE